MIPDQVLNDKIAFGKFYDDVETFYFSSNHGSCSSEVKNMFEFSVDQIFFLTCYK